LKNERSIGLNWPGGEQVEDWPGGEQVEVLP